MKKALLSLLVSFSALADCKFPVGNKMETIPDGASVSLTSPGKSLETHKIQDQDGMGSCYANAASVVLKSVLPKNPDISYIHGGLNFATRQRGDWGKGGTYVKDANSFGRTGLIDLGNVCGTFESLEKTGGACKADHSILENQTLKSPFVQQRLLINVGKYFDKINQFKGDPKKLKEVEKDISLALQELKIEQSNVIASCERNKTDLQFEVPLNVLAEIELLSSRDNEYCGSIRRNKILQVSQSTSVVKRDETRLQFRPEIVRKIYQAIHSDPFLRPMVLLETSDGPEKAKSTIKNILQGEEQPDLLLKDANLLTPLKQGPDLQKRVGEKIQEVLRPYLLPSKQECPITANAGFKVSPEQMGKVFLSELGYQRKLPCETLVKKWQVADSVKRKNVDACLPGTFNDLLDALAPLVEVSEYSEKTLAKLLTNPNASFADQLMKILTPGCTDKKNLISVKGLKCEDISSCWGNPVQCANEKLYTDRFRSSVMNSVKENAAVGFLACTGYFNDGEERSKFCQKSSSGVAGHQLHVMAISGYRCSAGKIEYEVINSWGKSCPAKEANGYKNGALTCVLDENGRPTGKFWVNEEAIVSNMVSYQLLTKEKKK